MSASVNSVIKTFASNLGIFCLESLSSAEEAKNLAFEIAHLQKNYRYLGVVFEQFGSPWRDWGRMRQTHRWLEVANADLLDKLSLAHIVLPGKKEELPNILPTELNYLEKMVSGLNSEGWLFFSSWLNVEIKNILSKLPPGATEEYQLEAQLKNFQLEVESLFLKTLRNEIRILFTNASSSETDRLSLEMKLIKIWQDFIRFLKAQYLALCSTIEGIEQIKLEHPELNDLYDAAILYKPLLQDELGESEKLDSEKKLLLLHILMQKLKILCVTVGDMADPSVRKALSLRRALTDFLKAHSLKEAIEMGLGWGEPSNPLEAEFRLFWNRRGEDSS